MRILLLADAGSGHTEKWATGLASRGIHVGLFSFNRAKTNWFEGNEHIEMLFQPDEAITGKKWSEKLRYFTYYGKLKTALKSFQPDILHAHYASSYGLMGALTGFSRFVVSVWGTDVYMFPKQGIMQRRVLKYVLKKANILCSTSEDMAKEMSLYTPKTAEIIPFGIDVERFRRHNWNTHEEITFGTVKALEEVYGIDRLIRAFQAFQKQSGIRFRLLIYGSGSQLNELKTLAQELGISDKVEFKGFVSGDALTEAYESMDVFMALSRSESFGVAILEASAMELPIIAANVGGLKEVVSNEVTGYLVNAEDQKDILNKMALLADDENKRKQLGENGRRRVLEKYDFQVNLVQQIEVYQQLLEHQ